ncbi:hypothetical protein COU54_04800 [Candidatus Pacearchaeota archaeon CG10_big_fil_rev_8_21_14_0_10_31_24]|nr:MAG: hypothetical protein COU54_04800 [Candidatus Pacearchaeota archaeon CG10_big_fil_rev_8_21_14_0_10_31_24]
MSIEINCPYYGYNYSEQFGLTPQQGNQCPFREGYSPCLMEIQKIPPNWKACDYNLGGQNPIGELAKLEVFKEEFETVRSLDDFANEYPNSPIL